jgi:L-seryl-tRNA(Ser) seleniumtransferase
MYYSRSPMPDKNNSKLRNVPSVDQLIRSSVGQELKDSIGIKRLTAIARRVTSELRLNLRADNANLTAETLLATATQQMVELARREDLIGIRRVINATGVVLHTNLGRAPLSEAARLAVHDEASRYCTLEYNSETGVRGRRGARVEALLRELTGAEDALVVNNCAAAALLILSVLAGDGETIVSRGELVEIGGDFRVPDVMSTSGTRMVEVGTTNRTHLADYQRAITPSTRLVMQVHPSNYRIVGFAATPELKELLDLTHNAKLPFYFDAGSGQLLDLKPFGVTDEPIISKLIAAGVDVVSFSGDKLLGSVQAGLIVGRQAIVERLRRHSLYRALRSDKLRLVALEATLGELLKDGTSAKIPTLEMLGASYDDLERRALEVVKIATSENLTLELSKGESAVGGGSGPISDLPTPLIAVSHKDLNAQQLESRLRDATPPVVCRIADGKVLLDLRTVFPDEEQKLIEILKTL